MNDGPHYLVTQRFTKIEAIGTWGSSHGTAADPLQLIATVTPHDDLNTKIEERDSRVPEDKAALFRLSTGLWALKLTPSLYQTGKRYVVQFRHWMTPQNPNTVRQEITWAPVEGPRLDNNCVVYGTLKDISGVPVAEAKLVAEQYKNFVTLNHRQSQAVLTSNSFGVWYGEFPCGALVRFVFGDLSKIVKIPDKKDVVSLHSLPEYQPAAAQMDQFGYPFPIGV